MKTKVMLCEFDLCVYCENRKCLAEEISITPYGTCAECLIPNIPDSEMEKYKAQYKKIRKDD